MRLTEHFTGCGPNRAVKYQRSPATVQQARLALVAACLACVPFASVVAATATVDARHTAFFTAHCLKCHGAEKQEGGVRLDTLSFAVETVETADRWQRVLDVLNSGDMPPEEEPRPDAQAKTDLLADLSHAMVVARKTIGDQGQTGVMRRLNRREYVNTIRDLLGVETDASGLPDDSGNGTYDTFGSSLFMSSDQIRRYLENGRLAVARAIAKATEPASATAELKTHRSEVEHGARRHAAFLLRHHLNGYSRYREWKASGGKPPTDFGFLDAAAAEFAGNFEGLGYYFAMYTSLPNIEEGAYLGNFSTGMGQIAVAIPPEAAPGEYILRIRSGLVDKAPPERRFMEIVVNEPEAGIGESTRVLDVLETAGTVEKPEIAEVRVRVPAKGPRTFFLQEKRHIDGNVTFFQYHQARLVNGVGPRPAIWVDWVEWQGPLSQDSREADAVRLFGTTTPTEDDESAREILSDFARRAFRGVQPAAAFIERLMGMDRGRRAAGQTCFAALEEPMAVVLASPGFLYLQEHPGSPQGADAAAARAADRRLTLLELASRISYFLWAAPPDAELLAAAADGTLANPDVLRSQVDRMVASPRSFEMATGFCNQWLNLDRLDFFKFNSAFYPEFDGTTKEAARQEVFQTFHLLLRDDVDARSLLKSDFVVVNAVLAAYYGIMENGQPVRGMNYRRVAVPPDSPRGGLMGMAAVLAMGSNGERTSPVERGAWVLRKILHDPPPPAPPNVPQLSRLDGKPVSPRERLRLHQEEPQCAQCHRRIDPIGFALENFDAVGKWRTEDQEREVNGPFYRIDVKRSWPLETAGTLRDGTPFKDYFDLRDRVAERGDAFLAGLVENLFQYAVGRPLSFADADIVAGIVARAKAAGGGLRDIVHEIVRTPEFQTK